MRVGITEDEANSTVSSLVNWVAILVDIIKALQEFLSALGIGNDSSDNDGKNSSQKK